MSKESLQKQIDGLHDEMCGLRAQMTARTLVGLGDYCHSLSVAEAVELLVDYLGIEFEFLPSEWTLTNSVQKESERD